MVDAIEDAPEATVGLHDSPIAGEDKPPRVTVLSVDHEPVEQPVAGVDDGRFGVELPVRPDPVDAILAESARLAMVALDALKGCRPASGQAPEYPRPSVRAATLFRAAASLLDDLG